MHTRTWPKLLISLLLLAVIAVTPVLAGCGGGTETDTGTTTTTTTTTTPTETQADEFEVIRSAAEAYLSSSPKWNVKASDLYMLINDGDTSNDPVIVSVRAADAYAKGHVPGAINIGLADLAKPESLAKLSEDNTVAYCYTGHTGSQATAILNLLGYTTSNMKFGMTSWTLNTDVASGRYDEAKDCMDYPFETTPNIPTQTYALPTIENTSSNDEHEIIRAAAEAYLTSSPKWNINASDLYMLINDGDPSNDPVIVSVRAADAYASGHVPGAINIALADLAKPENLAKLPTDRKIVVYCYTGHTGSQATAILNLLGYDVSNLKFGMTSWTKNTDVASGRYVESKDCMDYPYVTGTSPN